MLHKSTTRQSRTVHHSPELAWKQCDAPELERAGVSPMDRTSLISPGGWGGPGWGFWSPLSSPEENLQAFCFEQWKEGAFYSCLTDPQNLSLLSFKLKSHWNQNHVSAVQTVYQGKTHLLSQVLVMWQEPTCVFSAEQLSFARTDWSSAAGLEPGPTAGAVNAMIEAFNLTP